MTTKRKMRVSKNRIPSHITKEYLDELSADDFLGVALTEEEKDLVREYEQCKCDFEKWRKFRESRKVRK